MPPADTVFEGPDLDLMRAALAGDAAAMQGAIAQGTNAHAQGPYSTSKAVMQLTLLHYAVGARNIPALALSLVIVRRDAPMLDAFLSVCHLSKVPQEHKSLVAPSCIPSKCKPCMEVMFQHGMSPAISDSLQKNSFIEALSFVDFALAEWLLIKVGLPLSTQSRSGLTSANYAQTGLARHRPGTPTYNRYLKFKTFMESQGRSFAVETAAEWRARVLKP